MIIDLHKYLIFGNSQEMARFFSLAQRAGFLEFIGTSHRKQLELPEEAKTFLSAIKIAKHHPIHPVEGPFALSDPRLVAQKIVALKAQQDTLFEEERLLSIEIARVAIFGDFSRRELALLEKDSKRVFQYYCMKSALAKGMELSQELIYVGTEYDLDYFVAIHSERRQYPKMIEISIERPVGELRERLFAVREEVGKIEGELKAYAHLLPSLQRGLVECLNAHSLAAATNSASLTLSKSLFAIEAWVPETRIKALRALVGGLNVDCEEIIIEKSDRIPTYMENHGVDKLGEDLVQVYDIPAHTDKDPSRWILVFFALFFSMIISDAGYGAIFFLMTALLKWKIPRPSGSITRLLKLSFIISTCCMVWGVITGSYFGIELKPNNPLLKTSIMYDLALRKAEYHLTVEDDVYANYLKQFPEIASAHTGYEFIMQAVKIEDGKQVFEALEDFYDNLFMEFSFLVGILHISCAFCRSLLRNWAGVGWILFMAGGYLFFPSIVNATTLVNILGGVAKPLAHSIGLQLLIAGVALAFLCALFQRKWKAFHELLHAVQVFADVLSYLRLYALSLGGIVMARTFNAHLGMDLGFVMTFLLILLGHCVNIGLCVMGGVIHGLRLNFLEWYHHCFEGDGRLFNPLRLKRAK